MAKNPIVPAATKYQKLFSTAKDHPESYQAEITGTIPSWISGTLLKNGPGMLEVGPDKYHHWFDGLGLIHRFKIKNGKVEYSSKYLESNAYKRNIAAQRIVVSEFGTTACPDPCKTFFSRYFSYFFPTEFTDNDTVHFIQCGDEIYATSETTRLNKIDPNTLDTLEHVRIKNDLVSVNTATAHAHYALNGDVLNMGSGNREYKIIRTPKPTESSQGSTFAKTEMVGNIPMTSWTSPSYYHSFGMTHRYIIFPEMPLHLNLLKMLKSSLLHRPLSDGIYWEKNEKSKIKIFDMEKGAMHPVSYEGPTFFTFHHANSYEKDGCLIADMVCYNNGSFISNVSLEIMRSGGNFGGNDENGKPRLWRFVIPLQIRQDAKTGDDLLAGKKLGKSEAILQKDGSVKLVPEIKFEKPFEFPRYNYDYNGKEYRFLYGAASSETCNDILGHSIYKMDVVDGSMLTWSREHEFEYAGEPVFLPKPGATDEDDGVVLVAVSNVKEDDHPFLLVLDGKTMTELARAYIHSDLPPGFHNHFVTQ